MINASSNIFMVIVDEGKLWEDANCDCWLSLYEEYVSYWGRSCTLMITDIQQFLRLNYSSALYNVKFEMKWQHCISFMPAAVNYHRKGDTHWEANSDSVEMGTSVLSRVHTTRQQNSFTNFLRHNFTFFVITEERCSQNFNSKSLSKKTHLKVTQNWGTMTKLLWHRRRHLSLNELLDKLRCRKMCSFISPAQYWVHK
jgi:hypothetical protein